MISMVGPLKTSNSLPLKICYKIIVILALMYFCWTQILRIFKSQCSIFRENMIV